MFNIKSLLMCEEIEKIFPLDKEVRRAIEEVDREMFVPSSMRMRAYDLNPLPMKEEQWISSPLTVAKMTQYLLPQSGDSVLEIGCGSGYQAMVLSKIFRRVFSVERISKILLEAQERIRKSGAYNINTKLDDGQRGWSAYAPYDRILFSACAENISQAIIDQLQEGGILVAPILRGNKQMIMRFYKKNGQLDAGEILEECLFVPVLDGISH
ncbi:protein-L-isoaspartate(D-aspartate) O-methyltransferase [Helicobacter anatolicus]|uniref:protein-L-isoaspartate(D-aspartate) O-methyltransferase n=1 Tax=Helicobacter anatolicus TaxID=2905874 RepID=UPI001E2CD66E|nr:protein-L-isoaspartate(D-aspartate) O-methyltransferase [Helicobacter anatolicus]MCE3039174.1 protein-L-isoaspartate(D-aspartate) O-methyltransferase [Helicobacter anatolicus]